MSNSRKLDRQAFDVEAALADRIGGALHHMQIRSLADATLGVMNAACLAVSIIGQALAQAKSLDTKHATKQVDRLLSNQGIRPWEIFPAWVTSTLDGAQEIIVAMDWTEFDKDDQSTLSLNLVGKHGKTVPLVWLTIWKHELKDRRNDVEDTCLRRLGECLPQKVKTIILADRGFGDTKLFAYLEQLGFGYVIRFRDNIHVTSATGEQRPALEWVGTGGRARKLPDARITAKEKAVAAVVCVHDKRMKNAWCLATSEKAAEAREIINLYAKRWSIETSFRDTKDLRFGMGLKAVRLKEPERRDRLLLLNAFATFFLVLLGVAGEKTGMDRRLKTNTSPKRSHSLFRQGCMLFDLIPTMRDAWLLPLLEEFTKLLQDQPTVQPILELC